MKKIFSLVITAVLTTSILGGCTTKPANGEAKKDWTPEKEIEFVVPSSAGGGSDLNARTISDLAFKNKFSPKNFMIVNQGGGSGAVAFTNVNAKKGNPNTLMVLHSGQVMGSYVNNWDVKAEMLTYIGVVAFDDLTLCVKKESKFTDIKSLLAAVKEKPESVKIGGSQRGNSDHLSFELLNKNTNSKFTYVQFNSSGDAMSALLGGHVDAAIFNPSEVMGQIQAGKVIPLAAFSSERLTGVFKDTPTFKELGYKDIEVREVRAIAGPPSMPAEAVKFYEDMLKKVTETDDWKKNYIEKNLLTPKYMNAADTKKFFTEQIELYKKVFTEVGVMK
ncbi:tripartite tricarboxylate transporter substrate binding protein [Clostridium swellfunianum]|uniref:tripartite tricarboxylate transporter substrate binding protein n=1 Tax=Clostridium swellfunianum TaxID=1367462 RepID=UPI00202EECE5|nr:tripartite tricarboxylate transporter substrate binding protein [Clostridium swellfunianum]MCM0650928.1 tripartite tricarboxylate transporter substrate binding protein [Clostridium swellfunianum]